MDGDQKKWKSNEKSLLSSSPGLQSYVSMGIGMVVNWTHMALINICA